jgi:hypothetical protein
MESRASDMYALILICTRPPGPLQARVGPRPSAPIGLLVEAPGVALRAQPFG